MDAYRRAGVDLEANAKAVALIRDLAARATREDVVGGVGGFAGSFRIGEGRLLVAATDGVGTKLEVARMAGRLDTVGIDLVAMCANDIVCAGAEPLFFLDYLAIGRLVPETVVQIVEGVAEGCRRAGCALLGGETAEHPGVMEPDRFDLAGFCVGAVDEERALGPHRVQEGDALIGLASSGLHSNGYSLVRKELLERHGLNETPEGLARPLADELLEPTAIYAPLVLELAREGLVSAAAHITGGGFFENVPRALPERLGTEIDTTAWRVPPIFDLLRDVAGLSTEELFSTFNMGIGMILVVPPDVGEEVRGRAVRAGHEAYGVGLVVAQPGVAFHSS